MSTKNTKSIKIGAVSPKIRLADISYNLKSCISEAKRASDAGVSLLAFPELALTGATCGDLFRYAPLAQRAEAALVEYIDATADFDMVSLIGLPLEIDGELYSCISVVYRGALLELIPGDADPRYFSTPDTLSGKTEVAGRIVKVAKKNCFSLPINRIKVSVWGDVDASRRADIIVCPSSKPAMMLGRKTDLFAAKALSELTEKVCVFVNSGIGESTTDAVYSAHNVIAECGGVLAESLPFADDNLVVADVLTGEVHEGGEDGESALFDFDGAGKMSPNPFLPRKTEDQIEACLEAFEIQSQGLAARIQRSYSKTMVIGVSGGLDSTLALLVCVRAAEILGMDKKNIIGITMPCFGTTKRTKSNAEKLCEALGVSFRTVDIKASVTQHLSDIGHDGVTPNVTFENAQARERTQVLMDISNMTGGLVVGTGDLSELVLGWATYNGDHMSMYAVNASVPKTLVRRIVEVYSARDRASGGCCADILDDILATPVSPELLPPKDGEIAQCTEELVGPYELHDFFIYYTLNGGMSPREIYDCAKRTFEGMYENKVILGWLRVFVRRFISQQFKRSCMPDGPQVGCISVSPRGGLNMPSDASSAVWLEELDKIEKEEK